MKFIDNSEKFAKDIENEKIILKGEILKSFYYIASHLVLIL